MTSLADDPWVYVVTDVEVDGPWPGPNSMRSFASIAIGVDSTEHGRFEAVLEPLPGAAPSPATLAWMRSQPGVWEAATEGARPVQQVMDEYVAWIKGLPERRTFAASPILFDGGWIDYYLRRFTKHGLIQGPYEDDHLFDGTGLCIRSFAAAVVGGPAAEMTPSRLPAELFGDIEHTHKAIDDALGYANLLVNLIRLQAERLR